MYHKTFSRHQLANKVCLITGGAGFLGTHFSRAAAAEGATVVIIDVAAKRGERVVKQIRRQTKNARVFFFPCDIADERAVKKLFATIVRRFKWVDALVNNAYPRNKNYGRIFERVTYADFCENVNAHLGGYFLMCREAARVMKKRRRGAIINLASIYGTSAPRFEIYRGTAMTMPVEYAASKGAIVNLTKYLASYLGKHNIRVNALSPGGVFNNQPERFVKYYSRRVVLGGRMAEPADLVGAFIFLLSDASGYMTGQNVVVDGGWSL